MIRIQLFITPLLRQRVERIARREGCSLSNVARRALQVGLDAMEGQSGEAHQRRLERRDTEREEGLAWIWKAE